jgi:Peptidase A4 family/Ricin-type beta-trefoil lectin domain-like
MFRFLQRFGRDSQARRRGTGSMTRVRRRNHQLNCESLEDRQLLSAQAYYIVNVASGKVLDDPGGSTSEGVPVDQWQLNGGANQQWYLVPQTDGYYEVQNASSGLVLDDPNSSTSEGTKLDLWQPNGGANQQWGFFRLDGSNADIYSASNPNLVLDDPNSSTSNGTTMDQWSFNGGANQQWELLEANTAPVLNDYVVNAYSGDVLDDPNSSTSNGTTMDQWPINYGTNQQWTFVPLADGNYEIVNEASGLVLGDPGFSTSNGTGIIQWQLNDGMNEQWKIDPLSNGNYAIVNAYSNLALDDPNFSTSKGTSVIQYQWNGGMNQQWVLFVPNTTATTSPNWSGYVATTPNDSVTYVTGTWTVPTVTATSGNTDSFAWVGIDGYGGGTVEQVGTAQGTHNGVPYYHAWWEMWSKIGGQPEQTISTMTVSPGDSITASVTYQTSGTYAGDFLLSINDTSQSNDSFSTYANPQQYQDPLPDRSSAEWIMETPSFGGTYATLPEFSPVTFTNCYATISEATAQVRALNLNRNGVTLDTTSVLTSGTSFSVLYDSSGAAGQSATLQSRKKTGGLVIGRHAGTRIAEPSASTANGMTQIEPTVGATRHSGKKTGRLVIRRTAATGPAGLPRFRSPIGQHERFARGFLIDPRARHVIVAESDLADR